MRSLGNNFKWSAAERVCVRLISEDSNNAELARPPFMETCKRVRSYRMRVGKSLSVNLTSYLHNNLVCNIAQVVES